VIRRPTSPSPNRPVLSNDAERLVPSERGPTEWDPARRKELHHWEGYGILDLDPTKIVYSGGRFFKAFTRDIHNPIVCEQNGPSVFPRPPLILGRIKRDLEYAGAVLRSGS
jgi:hypothetical protein